MQHGNKPKAATFFFYTYAIVTPFDTITIFVANKLFKIRYFRQGFCVLYG